MNSQTKPAFCTLRRILVATDFSASGLAAFEAAVRLCVYSGASLYILNVFEYDILTPPGCGGQMPELDSFYQDAERSLDRLIQEAGRRGVNCGGSIGNGIPHTAILESIKSEDIELVVLGTRAIHGFERLVFGSTAESVLRNATCPVYTVGPQSASQDPRATIADEAVVFATDFSHTTTEALRDAATFAQLLKLPLHCLHVLPRGAEDGTHKGVIPIIIKEALQHLASTLDQEPTAPICAVTYGSEVSNAIVEYARQHHAKLIVLGVRRASLAASHVPAHIAYRIITEAPCPVLTMAFPLEPTEPEIASDASEQPADLPGASLVPWADNVLA